MRYLLMALLLTVAAPLFCQSGEDSTAAILEREAALETARSIIAAGEILPRSNELRALLDPVVEEGDRRQVDEARYLLFLVDSSLSVGIEESLQHEIDAYRNRIDGAQRDNRLFWLSSAGGVAGMGLFGLFSGLYSAAYGEYLDTSDGAEADRLEKEWRRWDLARYASLGIGTASLTAAALLFPSPAEERPADLYELRYKYAGLEGEAAARIERILQDRARLYQELETSRIAAGPYLKWRNISLISGGGLLAATATFLILGDIAYNQYNDSNYSSDALEYRDRVELYSLLGAGTGILSAVALSGAGALELIRPRPEELSRRLRSYDAFIRQEYPEYRPEAPPGSLP